MRVIAVDPPCRPGRVEPGRFSVRRCLAAGVLPWCRVPPGATVAGR